MNPYLLVAALGLAALIQVSLLPALAIPNATPNLLLVLVVGWATLRGTREAVWWALIGGVWLDLLSGGPFGLYTLSLLVVGAAAGLGGGTIYSGNIILALLMVAVGTLLSNGIALLFLWLSGHRLPPASALPGPLLAEAGYNLVLMLLLFPALAWLSRFTGRERLPLE